MTSKIDDGGLAFPGFRNQQVGTVADFGFTDDDSPTFADVQHSGMSLRDWFAGQAIASVPLRSWDHLGSDDMVRIEAWAKCAYLIADAMLAARSIKQEG